LFDCYLDQILVDGFFHADPHPGNLMLTDDGRLGLLRLGMVGRISPELTAMLVRLLVAISDGNGTEVAKVMAGLGKERESWDPGRFERARSAIVKQQRTNGLGQIESGRVVGELARIAADCGLRPPVELTMLSKTLLNLDHVSGMLADDFDPNAAIREHLGEIVTKRMLRSASPANLLASAM